MSRCDHQRHAYDFGCAEKRRRRGLGTYVYLETWVEWCGKCGAIRECSVREGVTKNTGWRKPEVSK